MFLPVLPYVKLAHCPVLLSFSPTPHEQDGIWLSAFLIGSGCGLAGAVTAQDNFRPEEGPYSSVLFLYKERADAVARYWNILFRSFKGFVHTYQLQLNMSTSSPLIGDKQIP